MLDGDVLIVSSDMDLMQCVDKAGKVTLYHPNRDAVYGVEEVSAEIGLPIGKFLDWRALQGDSSDNIQGVRGVGGKTATKLLSEFGDISGVYNAAMGRNPKGGIKQDKLRDAIISFGMDRIVKNILTMALYADRCGSRQAIRAGIEKWKPSNTKIATRYFQSQAFVSLMDGTLLNKTGKLMQPKIVGTWRYPRVLHGGRVNV
jgi:5'-3' exonuclease